MIVSDNLPPLRISDMCTGRVFGPEEVTVTEAMVAEYERITGDSSPEYSDAGAAHAAGLEGPMVPFGLIGVLARRSYLGAHRMQPGGVMAGQDITFGVPALVGRPLRLAARVESMDVTERRRAVVLNCEVRDGQDRLVGRVVIDARWPEDGP